MRTRAGGRLAGIGRAVLALSLFGLTGPAQAGGLAGDLDREVRRRPTSTELVTVVVQFNRPGVNAGLLARGHGGGVRKRHRVIEAATLTLPLNKVQRLKNHPNVVWISPDRPLSGLWDEDTVAMGADQVWSGTPPREGSGIGVAVLDSGVHLDVDDWKNENGNSRIVGWRDFVNGRTVPYDDNGHGTHVAGIVLGAGQSSTSGSGSGQRGLFTGVAPKAHLIGVKVLDANGIGTVSTVIAALDWCVANRITYNIRVINMSLGMDPGESNGTDPLCIAAKRAVQAGIVVVCSAGNKGKDALGVIKYGGIACPGNEPSVITVGALNTQETARRSDDTVCTFSSRGPTRHDNHTKPDVVAPGNKIISLRSPGGWYDGSYPEGRIDPGSYNWGGDSKYYRMSGTSMAAPQVAGAAALMLEANPDLAPNTVKGILMYTSQRLTLRDSLGLTLSNGVSLITQGAGSVNVVGAVEVAASLDHTQLVGINWLRFGLSGQTTIAGETFAWGGKILHRKRLIQGTSLISVRQQLWSHQVTWGEDIIWEQQVTWGEDGVEGDQVVWGGALIYANGVLEADCSSLEGDD